MTDQYDDENPRWTKADFARARGPEAMTEAELAAFPNTKRIGRPPKDTPKVAVSLRLDADVVEHFKATGTGWQTRMNSALREAAARDREGVRFDDGHLLIAAETGGLGRIALTTSGQELVVGPQAVVTEEIMVRKDVSHRTEEVRDTVRHTDVELSGGTHRSSSPRRPARG